MGQVECVDARHVSSDGSLFVCSGSLRVAVRRVARPRPRPIGSTAWLFNYPQLSIGIWSVGHCCDSLCGVGHVELIGRYAGGMITPMDDAKNVHGIAFRIEGDGNAPEYSRQQPLAMRCIAAPHRRASCAARWHGMAALLPGVQCAASAS